MSVDAEELRLLRALWEFAWNEHTELDYGDHVGTSWEDSQRLSDLRSAVEDHYVKHGGNGFPTSALAGDQAEEPES